MQTATTPQARQTDPLDPARATALAATLGETGPVAAGDPLPPFAHQVYFWDARPPDALGPDGHPRIGAFIPDMGFPRRMWAAGTLSFHAPLRAGIKAEKISRVESAVRKEGRSGPMALVRLRHDIRQRGALTLTEWQDLVYLPADFERPPPQEARQDETHGISRSFDPTLLFRYSALTFNGHRIHYDADYARDVEGYAGLVVHGPLLAHLLMDLATRRLGPLRGFSYRATAPLIAGETGTFCLKDTALWVRGPDGRLCMRAEAEPA